MVCSIVTVVVGSLMLVCDSPGKPFNVAQRQTGSVVMIFTDACQIYRHIMT